MVSFREPPKQYALPIVGAGITLDLGRLLKEWPGAEPTTTKALKRAAVTRRPYKDGVIAQVAGELRCAITQTTTPATTDPLRALTRLRDAVIEQGWTDGVCFTVVAETLDGPLRRPAFSPTDAQVALTLVAAAFTHPPALIWGTLASMDLMSPLTRLRLRWIRRDAAAPQALAQWESLRAHTSYL